MLADLLKYTGYWPKFDADLYLKYLKAKLAREENDLKTISHANIQIKK